MAKLDNNLRMAHDRLVPILVDDNDFWQSYFYEIEMIKRANGV
jgi:hypothetical protein